MKKLKQKKIIELKNKDILRVYSFQHPDAIDKIEKTGVLVGNPKFSYKNDADVFKFAYEWMQGQMKQRMPDYSGELPIWAWPTKPNTRFIKWQAKEPLVRIIADIPKERVLMSDFYLWHDVINEQHISLTEKEYDSIMDPTDFQTKNSWNHIFDITSIKSKEQMEWLGIDSMVQYCVDKIYKHEIVSIKRI